MSSEMRAVLVYIAVAALMVVGCENGSDEPSYVFEDVRTEIEVIQRAFVVPVGESSLATAGCQGIEGILQKRLGEVPAGFISCFSILSVAGLEVYFNRAALEKGVTENQLVIAANTAIAASLNHSHTAFYPIKREIIDQDYVGVSFGSQGDSLLVWEVVKGSPADKAGVKRGDLITAIDGVAVSELLADDNRQPDTDNRVTFKIRRPGVGELSAKVKTERLNLDFLSTQVLDNDVAYVRLNGFPEPSLRSSKRGPTFQEVFEERFRALDDDVPTAWIIDLRGNPGGSMAMCALLAGFFRQPGLSPFRVKSRMGFSEVPWGTPLTNRGRVVVLVDAFSFSASEIAAEALRQSAGALVVGEKTPGHAEVGTLVPIGDGILLVTIASAKIGPREIDLEGVGVKPDHVVHLDAEELARGYDAQLEFALRLLRDGGN